MASAEHKQRLKEAAQRLARVYEDLRYLDDEQDGMNEEAGERFARELALIGSMLRSVNDCF